MPRLKILRTNFTHDFTYALKYGTITGYAKVICHGACNQINSKEFLMFMPNKNLRDAHLKVPL